jgi:hypothetical protein
MGQSKTRIIGTISLLHEAYFSKFSRYKTLKNFMNDRCVICLWN